MASLKHHVLFVAGPAGPGSSSSTGGGTGVNVRGNGTVTANLPATSSVHPLRSATLVMAAVALVAAIFN